MRLCDHQRLKRVRVCGTIVAADVIVEGEEGYLHEVGPLLRERFLARGFLLRPLGNSVYVLPPYCIERPQASLNLRLLLRADRRALKHLAAAALLGRAGRRGLGRRRCRGGA